MMNILTIEDFFERVDNKDVIEDKRVIITTIPNKKRGRGSERQAKVLVMVESEPCISKPKKGKPNRKVGYLKMVAMEDLKSETINKEVHKSIEKTASVHSDGCKGYFKLKEVMAKHQAVLEPDYRRGL